MGAALNLIEVAGILQAIFCKDGSFPVEPDLQFFLRMVKKGRNQVVLIDLSSNRLTGVFPPEVKLLASDGAFSTGAGSLIALDLSNNEFVFNNFDTSWLSDLGSAMGKKLSAPCIVDIDIKLTHPVSHFDQNRVG